MTETIINGVVLDDSIAKRLSDLQNGQATFLANLLDDSIGFLLEYNSFFTNNSSGFVDVLQSCIMHVPNYWGLFRRRKEA